MERILLVEDDATLALALEYTLKNEGFVVDLSQNLKIAYENFHKNKYSLVLLDVMLPDGSGYDFCSSVRKKSAVPIIFLTACDEEVNVVLGLDIGGDDYITKPFRIKELLSRIKAVLRRNVTDKPQVTDSNILASDNIKADISQGKVFKNNEEIILTSIEYRLLLLFMKNCKVLLSRNQILEKLWDSSGEYVDDNTLSVYIRRLREKIEENPAEPKHIVTVRGLGYKWNMD
jgi:DNA-binding response OmpR family regulator